MASKSDYAGKRPGRFFVTIIIGVVGAFIGGYIGQATGLFGPVLERIL